MTNDGSTYFKLSAGAVDSVMIAYVFGFLIFAETETLFEMHPVTRILRFAAKIAKRSLSNIALILALLLIALVVYINRTPRSYQSVTFPYQLNPRANLLPFDSSFPLNYTVLMDFHIHSTISDGSLSPRQVIEWAKSSGYNVLFASDHQTLNGYTAMSKVLPATSANASMLIFPAIEFTSCRIHMNLLNINQSFPLCGVDTNNNAILDPCPWPTDDLLKYLIRRTHEEGGLVMVNHIPWGNAQFNSRNVSTLQDTPSLPQLLEWGVDVVEVVNQQTLDLAGYQFARKNGMIVATGSDMHTPAPPYSWTIAAPSNFTKQSVWEEIKANRTSFLYDSQGQGLFLPHESLPGFDELDSMWGSLIPFIAAFWWNENGQWSSQGGFCHPTITYVYPKSIVVMVFSIFGITAAFSITILLATLLFDRENIKIIVSKFRNRFPAKESQT